MKPVVQKNEFGCGAACVAFIVKGKYSKIVNLLGKGKAESSGFYCIDLVKILRNFEKNYQFRYLKPRLRRHIYKNDVIVFIKRSKKYPFGHYLVRYKKLWMDPWINFPKDKRVSNARAGFRRRLPGKPIYLIFQIF